MTRQDALSILITFIIGLIAGTYLYLTGFASFVTKISTPDAEQVSEFTIVGEAYGGCRTTCPSFQVTYDGNYRYLYTPAAGAAQIIREGSLSITLQRQLHRVLTDQALAREAVEIQPATCSSYVDGIDVRYIISLDGVEYVLNSCGTAVNSEGPVWSTLQSIWDYFERAGA